MQTNTGDTAGAIGSSTAATAADCDDDYIMVDATDTDTSSGFVMIDAPL
jgi:hypothetical protein